MPVSSTTHAATGPCRSRAASTVSRGRAQDRGIVPGGIGDEVMHRLMTGSHVAGIDPRRHRLHALPNPPQTEAGDNGAEGGGAVPGGGGGGEALRIRVETLGARGREGGATPR